MHTAPPPTAARHNSASPLTPSHLAQYHRDGYFIIPNLLTADECDQFLTHAAVTEAQNQQGGFLRRHVCHPEYQRIAHHPRALSYVRQILAGRPMIVQSMYLDKMPGGRGIPLHQDAHYLPNDPPSLMACWIALTDTDGDNGGFCVVPGTHRAGLLNAHNKATDKDGEGLEMPHTMRDRAGKEWKVTLVRFEVDHLRDADIRRLTVPRGSAVIFDGLVVHGSFGNHSKDRPRLAFTTHYVRQGTWLFRTDVQELVPAE